MAAQPGPPPPPPAPGQRGPPFGPGPFARPAGPGQNGPPPPAVRPPPPAGLMKPQINSTQIFDLTPKPKQDEKSCRKKLTTYSCWTIKKAPIVDPKDKPTWARSQVVEEKLQSSEIQKEIKRLSEARGKNVSVAEKKAALAPFQQGTINKLLDQLANNEHDPNFAHTLVQIDKLERNLKNGKRETTTMTLFFARAPLEHLSAIELNQNIENHKRAMAEARRRAEEAQAQGHPGGGQGGGQGPGGGQGGGGAHKIFQVNGGGGGGGGGGPPGAKTLSRNSSRRAPKKYHDDSSIESYTDSDTESGSDLSSNTTRTSSSKSKGHGRRRPSFNRGHNRSRSHHRVHQKIQYITDRPHSPPRRFPEVFDNGPVPRPYAPEVPRAIPSGVDPVAAAYQAGKIDADAERFGLTERERGYNPRPVVIDRAPLVINEPVREPRAIVSYGGRERLYYDDRYPSPPSPRYERYEERRHPEDRWADERGFRPRVDYARREREVEDYIERAPYVERVERRPIFRHSNPFVSLPRRYSSGPSSVDI